MTLDGRRRSSVFRFRAADRGDEIGAMARAVGVFRNNAVALRDAERARAAERKRAEAEKSAALEAVAAAFEKDILAIASSIGHAATELEAVARGMAAVLDESHRHARKAASAAEDTTTSATSVASAIEELSASIADIGTQVAGASDIVEEATRRTDSAVANTSALVTTVKDIDQVAALITAIASQTNLLALMPRSKRRAPARPDAVSRSSRRRSRRWPDRPRKRWPRSGTRRCRSVM